MASSTTTSFAVPTAPKSARAGAFRRRRISPQSGRALEILGHAIDYLADEYANREFERTDHAGRLEAIQLLMKVNRGIYFECSEVKGFRGRLFSWFPR